MNRVFWTVKSKETGSGSTGSCVTILSVYVNIVYDGSACCRGVMRTADGGQRHVNPVSELSPTPYLNKAANNESCTQDFPNLPLALPNLQQTSLLSDMAE